MNLQSSWTPEKLRAFEEDIKEHFLRGEIHAPIHLSGSVGGIQEQALIDIFQDVKPTDWVCSTHRSHYHCLLHGVPPEMVKAEILAGRSIHLNFKEHNFISSAIVGGCLPIALGLALAIKRKGEDRKVWCFIGDMSFQSGICHEVVKYAKGHDLPLNIVEECNGLSTNTPTHEVWGVLHDHSPGICLLNPRGVNYDSPFNTERIRLAKSGVMVYALERWRSGKVMHYCYERINGHINVPGKFVVFS